MIGWYSESIANRKIYEMWRGMLRRCYCTPDDSDYKWYKDCTVHPDFLLLSNFVKWIEQEPNYPLLVEDPGCNKWSIDKDGIIPGNKEYAPGKIRLIKVKDNLEEMLVRCGYPSELTKVPIVGIRKNSIVIYTSYNDARRHGYNVWKCMNKGNSIRYGYVWYLISDFQEIAIAEGLNI